METTCKFRILDEEQFKGNLGKIKYDSIVFDSEDYELYDYLVDNNYDDNDIDFDREMNSILITKDEEFVEYYDCIEYGKKDTLEDTQESLNDDDTMKTQEKANKTAPFEETAAYAKTVEKYGKATADRLKNEILEPKQEPPKQSGATRARARTK